MVPLDPVDIYRMSLSARRAWIEIGPHHFRRPSLWVALRKESVDRNHDDMLRYRDAEQSLSARRAWIEIVYSAEKGGMPMVALRKESVDRNLLCCILSSQCHVALRKESVDRNKKIIIHRAFQNVALRKESVDRNPLEKFAALPVLGRSPQGERG